MLKMLNMEKLRFKLIENKLKNFIFKKIKKKKVQPMR